MPIDIKLSGDTADAICRDSLKFHIKMIAQDIKDITWQKKMSAHDKINLAHQRDILSSLNAVYDYYGADSKT